ncbi:DUF4197 domain-containing protein [Capnocytophaga catalasegens]|uniref:DUF4197 domain-containing protein n=1 Tax=Capnocytophaga catalasegens TaxID=1004260 RepID=A0AAV5AT63_9FLAO|nr:DUF4197 domain-containing protein [Capnocytophaga catalasegens]GIZ16302.1 hypothetical protein RCZ03_23020 [Capnocytophaga catalasegens]GJM50534.1 hypothetical protein RCZ15_15070 [Capnocytophaga catalasegens]GJM53213.1 hypothetical protein RCZ16_15300 [Capnocytophaga catalasegens]
MKKITIVLCSLFLFNGCAELQTVVNNLPVSGTLTNADVSNGLKQALELGVSSGVDMLSKQNGYYGNNMVKILFPEQLQKVDNTLRKIGLSSLADEGIKLLNRAAEDAVSQAKPIFVSAIRNLTFTDAMSILTGNKDAATQYLQKQTTSQLVSAFSPQIKASLDKVGANDVWTQIMNKYNTIPFISPVNTDLTAYVTEKTIEGLFVQIAQKELDIRQNVSARTTPLLQKVFANQ